METTTKASLLESLTSFALTPAQKRAAKKAGMTYTDYAIFLRENMPTRTEEPAQPAAKEVLTIAEFRRRAKANPGQAAKNFTTKRGHHVTRTTRENLSNGSKMESIGITTRESFAVIDSIKAEQSGTWTINGAHIRTFTVKSSGAYVVRIDGKSVSKADALAFLKAN